MKLINVYDSKVSVCQGGRKLCEWRMFSGWEDPAQLWPEVNQYIQQVYGAEQTPEVVMKGNAAPYIKTGINYILKSIYGVDGYHASQYQRYEYRVKRHAESQESGGAHTRSIAKAIEKLETEKS